MQSVITNGLVVNHILVNVLIVSDRLDMKKIKLTQDKYALVDNDDFKALSKYKWFATKNVNTFYAMRNSPTVNGKYKILLMHRVIMQTPKGMHTDHIDHNGLNNQRKNLRVCTNSQNQMNSGKKSHNKSGFKGVSYYERYKKWRAQIKVNKKRIFLGYYDTKELGSEAYIKACKKYHGEYGKAF